ncbi:hypothetical protein [Streptomyces physcomitrii]|uniref:hypothetical protein n=1 Tax=Streptomyces physcomitrii TaxID=2724184 RepID=UPI001FEA5965|nr:hypothetical protein [Streptomyces physcomitrii]
MSALRPETGVPSPSSPPELDAALAAGGLVAAKGTTPQAGPGEEDELIRVRWVMPEGFFELPMEADTIEELADQMMDLSRRVLPEGSADMQLEWAIMCMASYDMLYEAGVQYSAFVMTEVDETRCTAHVNVSLIDLVDDALDRPAAAIAAALRALELGEVQEFRLPCGPAVSCVGTRQAVVDKSITPSGVDEPFWTSFIQVQVPLSNGTAVVLEMSTPTPEGWEVFSQMFAGVAKSLRLYDEVGRPVVMAG